MKSQFTSGYQKQFFWNTAANNKASFANENGTISSEQALLGDSAADHASVEALAEAKKVLITIPNGVAAVELRFVAVGTANLDDILQLYMAATTDSITDHYRHFSQLTITLGTQTFTATQEFFDTIVPANEAWLSTIAEMSSSANHIGGYVFNTHGNNKLLIIASDLDNTSIDVHWKEV